MPVAGCLVLWDKFIVTGEKIAIRDKSTVKVEANGEDVSPLVGSAGICISDSRVTTTGNTIGIFTWEGDAALTIERSDVTVKVTNSNWGDPAIYPAGDISIRNANVTAQGGGTTYPAICTNGNFIIADEYGQPASEVIADGGIKPGFDPYNPDASVTITPASGTWMQVHAADQKGGALAFENYFETPQSYPSDHELCTYGYVHIKAHEHTYAWVTDKEPTDAEDGSKHEECTVCKNRKEAVPIPALGHHFDTTKWMSDESAHWHACTTPDCDAIADQAAHTFRWVTDQEPTETTPGSKHEVCTVCGYAKAPVAIPVIPKTNVPQTGDPAPLALWLALLMISGTAVTVLARRKASNR